MIFWRTKYKNFIADLCTFYHIFPQVLWIETIRPTQMYNIAYYYFFIYSTLEEIDKTLGSHSLNI